MEQILVYADSISWGIIPTTRERLPFDQRWPGVFEHTLSGMGHSVRVMENCINGRRTVWDDPFKEGRNGAEGLAQVIEMHSPLKLVIIMLGTNDFQCAHNNDAWLSAQGANRLVRIVREAPIEPGMPIPDILLVSPPPIVGAKGAIAPKFIGAEQRCMGHADALKAVADEQSAHFFDAATVIQVSPLDGVHLDEPQHQVLGEAIAKEVAESVL